MRLTMLVSYGATPPPASFQPWCQPKPAISYPCPAYPVGNLRRVLATGAPERGHALPARSLEDAHDRVHDRRGAHRLEKEAVQARLQTAYTQAEIATEKYNQASAQLDTVNEKIHQNQRLLVAAVPYCFYCLASLVLVGIVMVTGLTIGPMRKAEKAAAEGRHAGGDGIEAESGLGGGRTDIKPNTLYMILPVAVLLVAVFVGLYVTGNGDILKGSGSSSILYSVIIAILVEAALLLAKRAMRFGEILGAIYKGMEELLPLALLLIFALTLGDVSRQLGTGVYLAGVAKQGLPAFLLPALFFGLGCVIAFATGTCYGTLAILVPIALPMAAVLGIKPALVFAACVNGGVFGNNCSPVADTSIVTAMAARIPVVDHIRTQLPYALVAAAAAFVMFAAAGLATRGL